MVCKPFNCSIISHIVHFPCIFVYYHIWLLAFVNFLDMAHIYFLERVLVAKEVGQILAEIGSVVVSSSIYESNI